MNNSDLIISKKVNTLEITINRPDQRNSLTRSMVRALNKEFEAAGSETDLRAVILRGHGGIFCSGADLGQIDLDATSKSQKDAVELSREFAALCSTISECAVPVITVVEGPAVGGGFGIACSGDICIAGPTAKLGFGAQRLGAVPGPIMPFVLDRAGFSVTKQLAVTGKVLNAQEAFASGIIHEMSDDVDGSVNKTLDQIFECGPRAVRMTKQMVLDCNRDQRKELIERACQLFGEIVTGEEAREGFQAFREKRAPAWRIARSK